jgi:hypothetical protein
MTTPAVDCIAAMFSEEVVLSALKEKPVWFVADHLLRMDSGTGQAADTAKQIAYRNELRCEKTVHGGVAGYRFWRIE